MLSSPSYYTSIDEAQKPLEIKLNSANIRQAPKRPKTAQERLMENSGGRIDRAEIRRRAGYAMGLNLPPHVMASNHAEEWVVIGGGPSINDHVAEIRALKRRGANIVSVNKSHDWLLDQAITPWGHVLLDPMEWVADYVKRPRKDVRYFVASQCHAKTFAALEGFPVFLWHAGQDFENEPPEPNEYLKTNWPTKPWFVVPGPTTVGLRVPFLANRLGPARPRKFHLFGFDSSRSAGKLHAYPKTEAPDAMSGVIKTQHRGRTFMFDTNNHMARQWADFDKMVVEMRDLTRADLLHPKIDITVYGSGLLPFYAATIGWHARPECNQDPGKVGGDMPRHLLKEADMDITNMAMYAAMRAPLTCAPGMVGAFSLLSTTMPGSFEAQGATA